MALEIKGLKRVFKLKKEAKHSFWTIRIRIWLPPKSWISIP